MAVAEVRGSSPSCVLEHGEPRAVDATFDGGHAGVERVGQLVVGEAFELSEYQRRALVVGQLCDGAGDCLHARVLLGGVDWVKARVGLGVVECLGWPATAIRSRQRRVTIR
jgi:hypothetical protein